MVDGNTDRQTDILKDICTYEVASLLKTSVGSLNTEEKNITATVSCVAQSNHKEDLAEVSRGYMH